MEKDKKIEEIKKSIEELESLKKKSPKENNDLKKLKKELYDLENANENITINKSLFSTNKGQETKYLNIFEIEDNPYQPRIIIDEDDIDDLAESIKGLGKLLQPISVAIFEGRLYLNVGQKRLKAFKKLYEQEKLDNPGMEDFESKYLKIFAVTIEINSLEELSDMALTENLARTNPFVIDTAFAMKRNYELHKNKEEVTLTEYTEMAKKKFGIKSKGTISKYFKISTLEEEVVNVVRELRFNSLSRLYYIAKSEISIDEKLEFVKLANNNEMSLKDFEKLAKDETVNSTTLEHTMNEEEKFPEETTSTGNELETETDTDTEEKKAIEKEFSQETNKNEDEESKIKKQKVDTVYVLNTLKNIKETTSEDKDRLIDELIEYLDNM
jgi:hypothetical protein